MINKKLYHVCGMCRSGLHVISHWILRSIGENCALFNTHVTNYNLHLPLVKDVMNDPFFPFKNGYHVNRDGTVILHEDSIPFKPSKCLDVEHIIGKSESMQIILILRDPYNLTASRVKSGIRLDMPMWKRHAKFSIKQKYDTVIIKYNNWVSSKKYRQEIAYQLDIPFVDKIEYVPTYGGGSSFDKLHYQGRGSQMRVLERWQIIRDVYPELFEDVLIKELSQQIFGFFPGMPLTSSV